MSNEFPHGPENAEHELRKAYNATIDTGTAHFWDRRGQPGVHPDEVITLYKHAYQLYRRGSRLAAERWARTAKHLGRAFWHEAKIAYLEPRVAELPYVEGSQPADYDLHQHSDTTSDLLDSVAGHIPPGYTEMPEPMRRYIARARRHLQRLNEPEMKNELLRVEHIKAAHEYGRVLECMALAYEAEKPEERAA